MNLNQTRTDRIPLDSGVASTSRARLRRRVRVGVLLRASLVLLVLLLAGGASVPAQQARMRRYTMAVAGYGFNLLDWEIHALREKATAAVQRPSAGLEPVAASQMVVDYLARAGRIGDAEAEMAGALSEGAGREDTEIAALQSELDGLRAVQDRQRVEVEQIVERQVGYALGQAGFTFFGVPFPPVQFTFTEPPKKLIVSPRDRIATEHGRMLSAEVTLPDIERAEAEINDERKRAYITNIGGLGAFPTMVVDRASLGWVLSTVAHEWVHNYLTLYPLGWNYFKSQDMTTLNESVAEIVGNEIGVSVFEWFYAADDVTPDKRGDEANGETVPRIPYWEAAMEADHRFDFRHEMRETRLHVDELLGEGLVEEAEAYMEARRQMFVESGYPLRVLNQAYFAFHGSYGTSAASTSPIGPKLYELRELTPDLKTFLATVRRFTDIKDLDRALEEWHSSGADVAQPS